MKLINQSAEYLPQQEGFEGIYKQIELAGRTSYLSYDKITDDSAKKFVDMIIKNKHHSVLEHGTVYLQCRICLNKKDDTPLSKYKNNKYSKCYEYYFPVNASKGTYVTTNLRVLVENNWLDDLQYICNPTEFHEKRLSVKVVTDIGITREFNCHRNFSITEQPIRYCNFSGDKFGNEITFIKPYWYDSKDSYSNEDISKSDFDTMVRMAERDYLILVGTLRQPQQARSILPLCTKTEVVYTAFESDWRHFFDQMLFGKTGEPHPQMKQLAELIKEQFEKNGL